MSFAGWNKTVLPRGAKKWLKENYANTPNEEIMARFGIKRGVLSRLKKELNLEKSEEFMRASRAKGFATMKEIGWPPKGYAIPNREKAWATLAERSRNRGDEWKGKISRSMAKQWKDEKRRVLFGLEQKTKRKVVRASHAKVCCRSELRSLGYIIPKGSNVAYWNAETLRNEKRERNARKNGIRFEPARE